MNRFERDDFYRRVCGFSGFGLYAVITEKFCAGRSSVEVLEKLARAGVKLAQLREKEKSKKEIYETALIFREITRAHGMLFIVNDHLDVALAARADGVHLGQSDLALAAARLVAPDLIIGISTHSAAEALSAQDSGADYVNIGPIFPTATKESCVAPLGVAAAKNIALRIRIPFTVMGGIKEANISEAAWTGAKVFAMVTEITADGDIEGKVRSLAAAFEGLTRTSQIISKNEHNLL